MNRILSTLLFSALSLALWSDIGAASIFGKISYSGSASGSIIVAVFTGSTLSHNQSPAAYNITDSLGHYSVNGLADGTYYIAATKSVSPERILKTDPWGYYGAPSNISPIVISGGNNISGINITIADGTDISPNPFADNSASPDEVFNLPETTKLGNSPSISATLDGTQIYLFKQNAEGADGGKVYTIIPETCVISGTIDLSLQYLPNRISWIDKLVYRQGSLWAVGGYGDPAGFGIKEGVFKVDLSTSASSNQISLSPGITEAHEIACDGTNFYIGVSDSMGNYGVVKFNPDEVSAIPSNRFIDLGPEFKRLCYGGNYLWIGTDCLCKYDPETGAKIANYNIPPKAAELYFNGRFWMYDEDSNSLNTYYLKSAGISEKNAASVPVNFCLFQNYPNPFNPSTTIRYVIPKSLLISGSVLVSLKIFNLLGQEVTTLINEQQSAGNYEVKFDAANLPSGIYLYKLQAGSLNSVKKLMLIK